MTLGEVIASMMTSSGGVRSAQGTYNAAVAAGAPQKVLDKLLKDVEKSLDEFNKAVLNRARQLNSMGSMMVGAGVSAIGNHYNNVASTGLNVGGSALMNAGGMLKPIGAVLVGFAAVAAGAEKLTQAFLHRADELGKFSPDIASAQAMNDVKLIMADMREAQVLGPDMARLMDASTDVQIQIRDLLLPIKKALVSGLATLLEKISSILPDADDPSRDRLEEAREWLAKQIVELGEKLFGPMDDIKKELDKMAQERKEQKVRDMNELNRSMIERSAMDLLPVNLGRDAGGGGMQLPVFQGL